MTTREVHHNAQRSFDYAVCVCGWQDSDDDWALLQRVVNMHNDFLAGELITVEEYDPSE